MWKTFSTAKISTNFAHLGPGGPAGQIVHGRSSSGASSTSYPSFPDGPELPGSPGNPSSPGSPGAPGRPCGHDKALQPRTIIKLMLLVGNMACMERVERSMLMSSRTQN